MVKVLCFGSLNIDKVFSLDHIVAPGETIASESLLMNLGGKGANQSVALAKAGLPVYFAGKIGSDGISFLTQLNNLGVNTDLVDTTGSVTGEAIIQVSKQGQNAIVLFPGANREIQDSGIDEVLMHFSPGDWVVLQNEICGVEKILQKAYARKLNICLNPSPMDETMMGIDLTNLRLLVVNEIEAAQFLGTKCDEYQQNSKRLRQRLPRTDIVLTAGKQGAFFYGDDAVCHFSPIVEAPVVDSTACGDTFLGYFVASQIRGFDVDDSLRIASKAASITVSRKGAASSIPDHSEMEAWFSSFRPSLSKN
jgi:ribokinase